jgi:hypothetical protein
MYFQIKKYYMSIITEDFDDFILIGDNIENITENNTTKILNKNFSFDDIKTITNNYISYQNIENSYIDEIIKTNDTINHTNNKYESESVTSNILDETFNNNIINIEKYTDNNIIKNSSNKIINNENTINHDVINKSFKKKSSEFFDNIPKKEKKKSKIFCSCFINSICFPCSLCVICFSYLCRCIKNIYNRIINIFNPIFI